MAYLKGPQLACKVRKGEATSSPQRVAAANCLLRLELSLRSQFWRERAQRTWHQWTAEELEAEHKRYFAPMIASVTTPQPADVLNALREVAPKRSASAAYRTLLEMQSDGVEAVRARLGKSTFHRHKSLLFRAGLTWVDFMYPSRPTRQPLKLGEPIYDWDDSALAA
jgi:hypothetical protein